MARKKRGAPGPPGKKSRVLDLNRKKREQVLSLLGGKITLNSLKKGTKKRGEVKAWNGGSRKNREKKSNRESQRHNTGGVEERGGATGGGNGLFKKKKGCNSYEKDDDNFQWAGQKSRKSNRGRFVRNGATHEGGPLKRDEEKEGIKGLKKKKKKKEASKGRGARQIGGREKETTQWGWCY